MNNSIAIALDQHDKQKEALAACDASLNFTHSPLCRRASRAATPPRKPDAAAAARHDIVLLARLMSIPPVVSTAEITC
jgi:hypothetical protein